MLYNTLSGLYILSISDISDQGNYGLKNTPNLYIHFFFCIFKLSISKGTFYRKTVILTKQSRSYIVLSDTVRLNNLFIEYQGSISVLVCIYLHPLENTAFTVKRMESLIQVKCI